MSMKVNVNNARRFAPLFQKVEKQYNIPNGLLFRQAQQESGFNPNVVNKYSGAAGLMQIMRASHPSVRNPLNPNEAVPYAGKYMRQLYDKFGSWVLALAAYNWGPGNVNKWLAGDKFPPKETRNYMLQIWTDVPHIS